MKTYTLLLFFGLLPWHFCAQSEPLHARTEHIRTTLLSDPEAARVLIEKLLTERTSMHDTIFLHTMILKGNYYQTVQRTTEAQEVYRSILGRAGAYPHLKARIYVHMGNAQCKNGAYPEAFVLYEKAIRIYRQIEDQMGMALVYGEMGMAYNLQFQYEPSLQYLRRALEIYLARGRHDLIAPLRQRLASTYMAKGDYAFAKEIIERTLKDFKKAGADRNYYATLINYAECMFYLGEAEQAKPVLHQAIRGLTKFEEHGYIGISFAILGRIAADASDDDRAQEYYGKALVHAIKDNASAVVPIALDYIDLLQKIGRKAQAKQTTDLVKPYFERSDISIASRVQFEVLLAKSARDANRPDQAYAAFENALALKDSMLNDQTSKTTAALQAYYRDRWQQNKIATLQSQNANLNETAQHTGVALYITLGVLGGVVCTSAWMILSGKHRRRAGVRAARARITARLRTEGTAEKSA